MPPTDFSVTSWFAKVIDYWWLWLLPTVAIFVLRNYIKNLWIYLQIRWSMSPYTAVGNDIQFSEGGKIWKVWRISLNNVYLEAKETGNGDLEIMRMPLDKFWNSNLIYKKV